MVSLGGRIKVNSWDDKAEMVKTAPVAITSARDKMPFEVTPFYPRLARFGASTTTPTTAAAGSGLLSFKVAHYPAANTNPGN